jgi:hypothetical protein
MVRRLTWLVETIYQLVEWLVSQSVRTIGDLDL